jgi:diaminopimelate decarboxylase
MDDYPLQKIATTWQTPAYVYSANEIIHNYQAYETGLAGHPHKICFAVKSNSNLSILRLLHQQGASFEVVSQGELERVLKAGGNANSVIFTGVGKTAAEIKRALEVGIFCFTVESLNELARIQSIAQQLNKIAPISLRINPDIDSKSHPNISTGKAFHKFGLQIDQVWSALDFIAQASHLKLNGLACHIGSQITDIETFIPVVETMLSLAQQCQQKGFELNFLNMGGGLGIDYTSSVSPKIAELTHLFCNALKNNPLTLIIEPGRSIVGNSGVLLTRVEYIKKTAKKNFAIVDCAMNDLMRPALYDGWHDMWPLMRHSDLDLLACDVVGPVCETTDVLGSDRDLKIKEGDIIALLNTGAYGFSMSSTYNTRPLIAEILVENDQAKLIRRRQSYDELFENELSMI